MLSTVAPGATMETLATNMNSTMETLATNMNSSNVTSDACSKSYNAYLSGATALLLLLLILLSLAGLLFLALVRKLAHSMDLWLTALLVNFLLWLLGKLIQELSPTGFCMFTQSLMFLSLLWSVFMHIGMAGEKLTALNSRKPRTVSNKKWVCFYLLCTLLLTLLVIIIIIIIMGPEADLNRGPNMCREGPTKVLHTAIQGFKATCYLLAAILIIILTIIIIWKLLHTKFGRRARLICNVLLTGLICAFSWFMLALPLLFLDREGGLGFECTESLIARYYPGPAALLTLLLILLYAWSFRHFMDSLRNQVSATAKYIKRRSSQST
uniref:BILF1 n=1 Tax=Piliocolobus badius lymphocryptovirus 1 TaxID=212719 RepID=A0A0A0S3Y1_9GAMA|nr:BILF1 [Piliocolobus badius lymphocryptovirus 1]